MIDNEIVKALKCCLNDSCYTSECFFFKETKDGEHCQTVAIKYALDLINRQKAEIDALRKTILDADYSSITALKAKESWHMENSIYIYQLNEWIDRLQADNSSMQSTLAKMSVGVEQAKAEAIKEFAERLKEKKFELDDQNEDIFYAVEVSDIENLAKEMVGEG